MIANQLPRTDREEATLAQQTGTVAIVIYTPPDPLEVSSALQLGNLWSKCEVKSECWRT